MDSVGPSLEHEIQLSAFVSRAYRALGSLIHVLHLYWYGERFVLGIISLKVVEHSLDVYTADMAHEMRSFAPENIQCWLQKGVLSKPKLQAHMLE